MAAETRIAGLLRDEVCTNPLPEEGTGQRDSTKKRMQELIAVDNTVLKGSVQLGNKGHLETDPGELVLRALLCELIGRSPRGKGAERERRACPKVIPRGKRLPHFSPA